MELDESSDAELASIASSSHSSPFAPSGFLTPFLSAGTPQKRGRIIAVPVIDSEVRFIGFSAAISLGKFCLGCSGGKH
jgi:hypothetical protein